MDLDKVPVREAGMTPYEIMLSESQERMLMVLKSGREEVARKVFEKWELDFALVGRLTDSGRMVLKKGAEVVADLPIAPLAKGAPEYDRPWTPTPKPRTVGAAEVPTPNRFAGVLERLLASPDLCVKRWIWEQYDHMVMGDTVVRPGGDAAVVRVHGTNMGVAVTTDCTPRYCFADPETGGAQAVAEAWRNLTAVGARPLAVTDCLNFGSPERPEIMGQFAGCVRGVAAACRALDFPVVSGNVSFYNETNGEAVLPTPTVGGVGIIDDVSKAMTLAFKGAGEAIVLVGETTGHLGVSQYLREVTGADVPNPEAGAPPPVDLKAERRNGDFVRGLIGEGRVGACHDVSDGGLYVAIAEMAVAGGMGVEIVPPAEVGASGAIPLHAWLFGEDQARYIVTAADGATILNLAEQAGVPAAVIGTTGGDALTVRELDAISIADLSRVYESWLPAYMARR
jgi:phosphoribosylformylglycinamidine synthase